MDPGARRAMWGAVLAATAPALAAGDEEGGGGSTGGSCAVVLTTHSMEEVEVLCSRVGIMHKGRLACLGSPQRLKALYGGGSRAQGRACDSVLDTMPCLRVAPHVAAVSEVYLGPVQVLFGAGCG